MGPMVKGLTGSPSSGRRQTDTSSTNKIKIGSCPPPPISPGCADPAFLGGKVPHLMLPSWLRSGLWEALGMLVESSKYLNSKEHGLQPAG